MGFPLLVTALESDSLLYMLGIYRFVKTERDVSAIYQSSCEDRLAQLFKIIHRHMTLQPVIRAFLKAQRKIEKMKNPVVFRPGSICLEVWQELRRVAVERDELWYKVGTSTLLFWS